MTPSRIKNWRLHNLSCGVQVFTGIVEHDERGRFDPGFHMRSSVIEYFDRDSGNLATQNTHYLMDMETENQDPFITEDLGDKVVGISY